MNASTRVPGRLCGGVGVGVGVGPSPTQYLRSLFPRPLHMKEDPGRRHHRFFTEAELDTEIKKLEKQIAHFKVSTVYPVRPVTQPTKLYIREKVSHVHFVPGYGSSGLKEQIKESYKSAAKEYLYLSKGEKLKYIEKARKNRELYEHRMKQYFKSYREHKGFAEFALQEKELRKLKRIKKLRIKTEEETGAGPPPQGP